MVTATLEFLPVNTGLPSTFDGLFVQGKSKIRGFITFSEPIHVSDAGSALFEGSRYIPTYGITIDNMTTSGYFDTDYIVGERIYSTGYAVPFVGSDVYYTYWREESGGSYSSKVQKTVIDAVYSIPYSTPGIVAPSGADTVICARCQQDGTHDASGTYLHIKCARKYAKAMHGTSPYDSQAEQLNFCSIRYRYKASTSQTWSAWTELLSASDLTTDSVDTVLSGVVTSTSQSYDIEISAVDTLGGEGVYSTMVPTGNANFHLRAGGSGAAFGKFAEHDDMLEVNYDLTVNGAFSGGAAVFDDIKADALACKNGISPFYADGNATGLWSGASAAFVLGVVLKRDQSNLLVIAYQLSESTVRPHYLKYYSGTWSSWQT